MSRKIFFKPNLNLFYDWISSLLLPHLRCQPLSSSWCCRSTRATATASAKSSRTKFGPQRRLPGCTPWLSRQRLLRPLRPARGWAATIRGPWRRCSVCKTMLETCPRKSHSRVFPHSLYQFLTWSVFSVGMIPAFLTLSEFSERLIPSYQNQSNKQPSSDLSIARKHPKARRWLLSG